MRRPSPAEAVMLVVLVLLFIWAARADAAPITFQICDNPTFKKDGEVLLVRCPGQETPAMKVYGCVGPKITREGQKFTLTCNAWVQYEVVKK